jgi:hypothetical protein
VRVAAPLVAVGVITVNHRPKYAADGRIITSGVVPGSSAEADEIVSQSHGLATGRAIEARALRAAGVQRNLDAFISHHITVSGLSSSQLVDLQVTDRESHVAKAAADALVAEADPGMRPKYLWAGLEQRQRAHDVLFTNMSPHSVESGLNKDLAMIAIVFDGVLLPAGTG